MYNTKDDLDFDINFRILVIEATLLSRYAHCSLQVFSIVQKLLFNISVVIFQLFL